MGKQAVLEVTDLYKNFGKLKIINRFSLSVFEGDRHAIIGPNGAGKTTIFNLLSGLHKVSHGSIVFKGQDITGFPPHQINRIGIARSFQITNVFPKLSVFENVRPVLLSKHNVRYNLFKRVSKMEKITRESLAILDQVGLLEKKDVPAGFLSYGEQRALEVGITIASDPEVILLDEPTAGMSIEETHKAIDLIDRVTRGKTLIIIEHDMDVVFSIASVITVMHYGTVIATGEPETIRDDPQIKKIYLGEK
jgi:branched-chain amino acid transport system ATP-binding protein